MELRREEGRLGHRMLLPAEEAVRSRCRRTLCPQRCGDQDAGLSLACADEIVHIRIDGWRIRHSIQEADLRHRIQRQLNRGELRHKFARRLFFANQGAFQTGDYEEIMNKASCLSLLCNAALVWNTVQMSRIIGQLRATGVTITDEDVALISPLTYAHVIPNGTYFFDRVGEADMSTPSSTY
jgi:Tn3 transposase DDE domain